MEREKSSSGENSVLCQLRERMQSYRPRHLPLPPFLNQAAVLIPVTAAPEPELILTVRTQSMPTHAGEVAFPGGRHEKGETIRQTAFREANEEVGIEENQVEFLGQLTPLASKHGMKVTPFVGVVDNHISLVKDPREIDEIFQVPLTFFLQQEPELTTPFKFLGTHFQLPNYYYEGKRIWGLTAFMIIDLINHVYDAGIDLRKK